MKFTEKDDYKKFYVEIPDPNFSPTRNQAIVNGTIKKTNAMRKKKADQLKDPYAERVDAMVSFLKHADKTKNGKIKQYFEPKYLAYLRGEDIRREMLARMSFKTSDGQDIVNPFR
jgi:hypothetical protein